MRFDTFIPAEPLRPYIKRLAVAEHRLETEYKVLPATGLVAGFQYSGQLAAVHNRTAANLSAAGITGLADSYKIFRNAAKTGTILVYFTETGLPHFTPQPAHELFGQSLSLDCIFDQNGVRQTEEKLSFAHTDGQRIRIVEQYLMAQLTAGIRTDGLVAEAVQMMYQTGGAMRMKNLCQRLFISQSPFEKRFRKVVGTTPKKWASIVRLNAVLRQLSSSRSLTDICYENSFFDQAHFIKSFRQFAGDTPEHFRRSL